MNKLLNVESNRIHLRCIFENPLYKKLVMLTYVLSFPLLEIFMACLNTKLVEILYTSINAVYGDGALSFCPTSRSILQTFKLNKDKIHRTLPRNHGCSLTIVNSAF